jgi:hypothetical protein
VSLVRAHILPRMILPTVSRATPNLVPMLLSVSPLALAARMLSTFAGVSFLPRFGEMEPSSRPPSTAWRWFFCLVHHSRFTKTLLSFVKSIWFTCASGVGGGPMKAVAAKRWTLQVSTLLPFDRCTCIYPRRSGVCLSTIPRFSATLYRFLTMWSRLLTLPKELTSYNPSYPGIDRHSSLFIGEL